MPAPHIGGGGGTVRVLAFPALIHLPAVLLGRQQLMASGTYVGGLDGVPGSWLWPGGFLTVAAIWGVNHRMEGLCLSLSLSSKQIFNHHHHKPSHGYTDPGWSLTFHLHFCPLLADMSFAVGCGQVACGDSLAAAAGPMSTTKAPLQQGAEVTVIGADPNRTTCDVSPH